MKPNKLKNNFKKSLEEKSDKGGEDKSKTTRPKERRRLIHGSILPTPCQHPVPGAAPIGTESLIGRTDLHGDGLQATHLMCTREHPSWRVETHQALSMEHILSRGVKEDLENKQTNRKVEEREESWEWGTI